jgi:hypothetical protein
MYQVTQYLILSIPPESCVIKSISWCLSSELRHALEHLDWPLISSHLTRPGHRCAVQCLHFSQNKSKEGHQAHLVWKLLFSFPSCGRRKVKILKVNSAGHVDIERVNWTNFVLQLVSVFLNYLLDSLLLGSVYVFKWI